MTIDTLLAKFDKVKPTKPNNWMARCPAHDDRKSSLSISFTNDKALVYCFAGCEVKDILAKANLTYADLFFSSHTAPIAIYQYRKADGTLSHEKLKFKTADGKRFTQRQLKDDLIVDDLNGVQRIPYHFKEVVKTIKQEGLLLYVEGEKDADTAKLLGYTATTMGGASDWKDEYKGYFKNANVVLIPDKDDAGLKLSENIITSLRETAKSLRIVILPKGKDLTEWMELGNKDITPLISDSKDLITYKELSEPTMTKTLSGYDFTWQDLNLLVKIDRLSDSAEGIIIVKDLARAKTLHTSKINLLSTTSLRDLAKRLTISKKVQWDAILSQITNRCFDTLRDGSETINIDQEPLTMRIDYLLEPLLPLNEPVTIFTAGGKGKSIFADYIAVLVQHGIAADGGLPFVPRQANVLYLDWETDEETHRRYITAIKKGMAITDNSFIAYKRLEYPLAQVIDTIRAEIINKDIGLVIIDSQMAATASGTRGLTEAQVASEYYNLIRSFHCSTLTIDHITKEGMISSNGAEAPYGSVVKYNRARSVFELKLPDEEEDNDHKEYALLHRKFNLGRKQKPLGIALDFTNTQDDALLKIEYAQCDISASPSLNKFLSRKIRLINALKDLGTASIKDLADYIGEPENTRKIGEQLANDKKNFVRVETGVYGLVNRGSLLA